MQLSDDEDASTAELDKQALLPVNPFLTTAAPLQAIAPLPASIPQARMLHLLQQAFNRLEQPDAEDHSSDAQLLAYLHEIMLDPVQFVAGNVSKHLVAWQALFAKLGHSRKSALVLYWIRHGVVLEFVSPFASGQQQHPRYHSKLKLVEQLLQDTAGPDAVHSMLHRDLPAQVQFANRVSCSMHKQIVDKSIHELVAVGSLMPWQRPQPPEVINGMGVVQNRKGKVRLILDARYVNMFVPYEHFAYEKLADVPEYMQAEDWFVLTDAKSGYHHIPMHARSWTYFAVEWCGVVYTYSVVPFGFARACRDYTWTMAEVYKPLRLHGMLLTFVIDDALLAARTRGQCVFGQTLDVFAGGAKDQHHVSRFYSQYFTPAALAASAMFQNWAKDACSHGRSGMLWVFPPFRLIGAVINKLLAEQTNAIVILPRFLRFWTAMLKQLPVFAVHELSYYDKLYTIGSRAPKNNHNLQR